MFLFHFHVILIWLCQISTRQYCVQVYSLYLSNWICHVMILGKSDLSITVMVHFYSNLRTAVHIWFDIITTIMKDASKTFLILDVNSWLGIEVLIFKLKFLVFQFNTFKLFNWFIILNQLLILVLKLPSRF